MTFFDDVLRFHSKFKLPHRGDGGKPALFDEDTFRFRFRFLQEELDEFQAGFAERDLAKCADAMADLVYVALGTAAMMRVPFNEIWAEVQQTNMSKVRAADADDPASTRKHRLDVVKPSWFTPPDIAGIIASDGEQKESDWDARFMALAEYVAFWSKDPSTKVGAVLVGVDRREIAVGYNGFPPGISDDDRLNDRLVKYQLMQHAERNVLDNARFIVDGATLYCTQPPCLECAKSLVSRGISRVVSRHHPPVEKGRWTETLPVSMDLLSEAGIEIDVLDK